MLRIQSVSRSVLPLKALGENFSLSFPAYSDPRSSLACGSITLLSVSICTWPSLHLHLCMSSLLIRTPVLECRTHSFPVWTHYLHLLGPLLHIRSHPPVQSEHEFWGDTPKSPELSISISKTWQPYMNLVAPIRPMLPESHSSFLRFCCSLSRMEFRHQCFFQLPGDHYCLWTRGPPGLWCFTPSLNLGEPRTLPSHAPAPSR